MTYDELAKAFPRVFRHYDSQNTGYGIDRTRDGYFASPFHERGFEHPDGWTPLVIRLAQTLENLMSAHGADIWCEQVKSKFGELRFYVGYDYAPYEFVIRTDAAIRAIESESRRTCEQCGKPGQRKTSDGWVYVECDDCANKAVRA
jgi:hypothetical protein